MPTKHDTRNFVYGHAPWPGKMSVESHAPKNLDLTVSRLLNKQVRQLKAINSGRFRISNINDTSANLIHMDSCDYAGVVYLNNNIFDTPGTLFYTHKETKVSYGDKEFFEELIKNNQVNDVMHWEINLVSFIVYNRLIVYPANLFHGIGPLFGTNDNNSRLIQVFFWETL